MLNIFPWRRQRSRKLSQSNTRRRLELECLESREVLSTLFALTNTNHILQFDSASPTTNVRDVAVTGLQGGAGERLVGIDFRPRTGQLFAVGVANAGANDNLRLYTLSPLTGVAKEVGATPVTVTAGTFYGVDFNPTVDRLRVVNSADVNIRLNPNNGTLAGADTNLNPAGNLVDGAAYDRNFNGSQTTTLYAIARNTNSLVIQGGLNGTPSPNGGTLTPVGALGVTIGATNGDGFDIAASGTAGGTGLAVFTNNADAKTGLYRIDLGTGAATLIGLVGDGNTPLNGLAIAPSSRYVVATTGGTLADVRVFDGFTNQQLLAIVPFAKYAGEVRVALADVNRDSVPDVIVGATVNGHVKVFDGVTGAELRSFLAFDKFGGSVHVAGGDVNGDGFKDIIVAADNAPGGHVKAFSGADGTLLASFFSFDGYSGPVAVGAADFNLDNQSEIIAGANNSGHVKVLTNTGAIFSSSTFYGSFLTFPGFVGSISVAGGDVDGDGIPDVVVGASAGPGHVKAFSGANGALIASFFAYESTFNGGVSVALADFNMDGRYEIRTASGRGRQNSVRAFDALTAAQLNVFQPFTDYTGGINIGGAGR